MKRHRGSDGWGRDSYDIPDNAVAGGSDTGSAPDSPAPTSVISEEVSRLRQYLQDHGIESTVDVTASGNVFMTKMWVVVSSQKLVRANELAGFWLKENEKTTRLIHDAT